MSPLARARRALGDVPRRIGYGWGPRLASALRRRWVLLRHRHADVRFLGPVHIGPGFSLHIPAGGSFVVGPGVEFRRGFRAEVLGNGRIEIGAGTIFTYDVIMQCTTSIEVGERCAIGQATMILDGQHRFRDLDTHPLDQGFDFSPVHIGDHVLITSKVTVMSDVGERAFVGAHALVTRPAPAYCVVVGAPARAIEYFGPPGGEPPELAR